MPDKLLYTALACASMLILAVLLFALGRREEEREEVIRRLDEEMRPGQESAQNRYPFGLRWIFHSLQRAGIANQPGHLVWAFVISGLVGSFAIVLKGTLGLLTALILLAAGFYLFIAWRISRIGRTLRQQLPAFIDQIIRTLSIGRSFDNALLQAIETSPAPLSDALKSVVTETALGGDLAESLEETAKIYQIKELHLLTLALRINQRYGGSIKTMLENIITLIRQQEQAERELRALTGETRLSAWVLGTMPLGMAGYMMIVNPTYLSFLLQDPNGPAIVYTALGLQAAGGLILWRMMRSIR